MTPEQIQKALEMADVLEKNRDDNFATMPASEVKEQQENLDIAAEEVEGMLKGMFNVSVEDMPLLTLAMTQYLGARVMHVIDAHQEMSPEEKLTHLASDMMGSLEVLVHMAIKAVRA